MTRWNGTGGAPVIYQMLAKRKKKSAYSIQEIRKKKKKKKKKYGPASRQGTELFWHLHTHMTCEFIVLWLVQYG